MLTSILNTSNLSKLIDNNLPSINLFTCLQYARRTLARVSAYLQADRYALGERSRWKDDMYLWSDRGADDESVGADVVRLLADSTDDGEVARQIGGQDARHSTIIQLIGALHLCTHPCSTYSHLFI